MIESTHYLGIPKPVGPYTCALVTYHLPCNVARGAPRLRGSSALSRSCPSPPPPRLMAADPSCYPVRRRYNLCIYTTQINTNGKESTVNLNSRTYGVNICDLVHPPFPSTLLFPPPFTPSTIYALHSLRPKYQ